MAELKDTPSAAAAIPATRSGGGFELRLERGAVHVRLAGQPVAPGVRVDVLTLQIPDAKFPFDVGQGAGQFRHRLADLVELAVTVEPVAAEGALAGAGLAAFGVEGLQLAPREGFLELAGRLSGGPAFTLEAGLLPAGDQGVALLFHAPRVLGPAPLPAAALPHLARAVIEAIGPEALPAAPLAPLLRRILAPRGWKLPRGDDARLARATLSGGVARLTWDRAAANPAVASVDPALLAADEGARAFSLAEALVARGDYPGAREAYLAGGGAAAAHPFAAERLLSLLTHDERYHEEALDLAGEWLARRPGFEPALAAEAAVRVARGEAAKAARVLGALAAGAAARGRPFLALAAAEATLAVPGVPEDDALRAVDVALQLRRDHLPALRALRAVARARNDREGLLRASRRLVAYEPDPAAKARAHAELGELLLDADPPGARLHLDQALRLAPDDVDAQAALARACAAAGEPLRAVRALDRLRELLTRRGERERAAQVALDAGALWEGALGHPENALLRYREAADLHPTSGAHARAARAAEAAGHWAEAADHHAAALARLDPAAPGAADLAVRTHLALADVAERRLADPAGAAAHLAEAAALAPADAALLRRLAALERSLGRTAEALRVLERLAPLEPDPAARAALLAEAGEGALALGLAGDARARFTAALAADPGCRPALLGAARLARERGDAVAERDALERLLPLAAPGAEAAEVLDRLASARDRAGDLAGAAEAAAAARAAAPSAARLEACLALARRADDRATLAALLADRAREAAVGGDAPGAAEAWLERARLLAASPAQALAALAEARAVSPGHPAVLRAQAGLAEATGDPRLALGCLRALLAGAPEDGPTLEVRAARAALAAGEIGAAKDHAERALSREVPGAAEVLDEILSRSGDDAARADILGRLGRHLEAARLLEQHGDAAGARAALERAAADPAAAPRALPRLSDLRLAAGDRAGAAAALLALARLGEGREAARLALQAFATGREPVALDLAAEKDPRFAPARARRATLRAADDPRAALADAEAALAGDGLAEDERPGLLALAARAAAAAGDGAAARRHLGAYCEATPEDDGALARLAALHRAAGAQDDLARVLARRLPLTTGADGAAVRLELSELLAPLDPARAARLALDALEHDAASAGALRALTTAPRAAHVPPADRAALLARLAATAAATPPEAAAAHAARARLLAESGDAPGALEAAREAARLGEEPDDLLELRARLAEAQGDLSDAARSLLERARRAAAAGEPQAGERLADAGLRAVAAGVPGGEDALRAALALAPERETIRAVLEALVRLARARDDAEGERALLPLLVPALPTGARPAALLRLSSLALEAKDPALARASAEEARALAPRELAAVEACRSAALAAGDLAAVAALLADAAELDPSGAGPRLLDRARLLAALGRSADADGAYAAALAALPADRALADEHARLRRDARRAPSGPLEVYARRAPDAAEAASALRAGAALALSAGDAGAALRCARGAWARTGADPAFAGPLLARVLYLMGGASEALVVHRRLLDAGISTVAADDAVAICRQAADLAADAGDAPLALRALDELLRLRPQELDAAVARLELDPDRARAARALAEAAGACRSRRRRVLALARASEVALAEAGDPALAAELLARAGADAAGRPELVALVARRRAAALRAAEGSSSSAYLAALREASGAAVAAGDRAGGIELLEEAIRRQRERGLFADAARDLLEVDGLAAADGDLAESAGRLRAAGALLRTAGDLAAAAEVLRRAYGANPESEETARRLEEVLRERGAEGAAGLVELLGDRAARASPGPPRAAALVSLAAAHAAAGAPAREEEALRAALAEAPGLAAAMDRLLELLAASRRTGERARLLLERSASVADPAARTELRREAARALASSPEPGDRDLAAEAWRAVAASLPSDLEAARGAAGLLVGLGRREDAIPHLETLVRADPADDAAADELAAAWADRPLDRAELFVARAAGASGERRAALLREAAGALFTSGDDERARAVMREAFQAWPADGAAFEEAVRDASADVDRLDAVLATRARAVPAEAASCHRARGDALRGAGRVEDAIAAYEAARSAAPDDVAVAAALAATIAEARGDTAAADLDRELVARAEGAPGEIPAGAEAQARFRLGLALSFAGRSEEAVPHLERALSLAPHDGHAGLGWSALAQGYASRGDAASALAAARARVERASALGFAEERRAAREAEAELADRFGLPSALGPGEVELRVSARASAPAEPGGAAEPPAAIDAVAGDAQVALEPAAAAAGGEERLEREPPSEEPGRTEPFFLEAPVGEEQVELASAGQEEPGASEASPDEERVAFAAPAEAPGDEEPVAFVAPAEAPGDEEPVAFAAPAEAPGDEEPVAFEGTADPRDELVPSEWSGDGEPSSEEPVAFGSGGGDARFDESASARAGDGERPPEEPVAFERGEGPRLDDAASEWAGDGTPATEEPVAFDEAADETALAGDPAPDGIPAGGGEPPGGWTGAGGEAAAEDGDPSARAAAWLASADALARAGSSPDDIRAALDMACEVDPDAAFPWSERARIEEAMGEPLVAARSQLAVWIRSEGDPAADAALEAARLFEAAGEHADAARAYRGAVQARPGAIPDAVIEAADALAAGDPATAARRLAVVHSAELPPALRGLHLRKLAAALAADGRLEAARATLVGAVEADPADTAAAAALEALDARAGDWSLAAAAHAAEAAQALDAAEGAALYLRAATLLRERVGDTAGAIAALRAAFARAGSSDAPAARATAEEAAARLRDLGAPAPPLRPVRAAAAADASELAADPRADDGGSASALAPEAAPGGAAAPDAPAEVASSFVDPDPLPAVDFASTLAAEANATSGPARADLLERLASHRAAFGDRTGALEALLGAIEADPGRAATFSWLVALSDGDEEILARAEAARGAWIASPDATAWEVDGSSPAAGPFADDLSAAGGGAPGDALAPGDGAEAPSERISFDPPLDGASAEPPAIDLAALEPTALAATDEAAGSDAPSERISFDPPLDAAAAPEDAGAPAAHEAEPPAVDLAAAVEATALEVTADAGAADLDEEPPSERFAFDDAGGPASGAGATPAEPPTDPAALAREGRARLEARDWTGAYERLSLALAREPSDLTLARDLSRVCEKLGLYDEYVQLGEVCADAISAYDPLAAAARYRHFAEVMREKLGSPDRAASMLEKALALVPEDPDTRRELIAVWTELPGASPRALDAWLDLARKDPSDAGALAAVALLTGRLAEGAGEADGARLRERGRIAASLAAFASPSGHEPPPPGRLAVQVSPELRARVAAPGATGPLARLVRVLAPWLESLFPADLRRRGAGAEDRLDRARAPAVAAAFQGAGRVLRTRPHATFLLARPAVDVAVENTAPPSIVLGGGVAVLDDVALAFLAARTLDLVEHGWALVGKFAPRDVGILLELACRFAGGAPPSLGLPPERAGAFLAVLETQVPPAARRVARELGPGAAQELEETDPRALAAALRRTANRVALLYAGDPGAALRTLALVDRRLEGGPVDPAQALALPDLRDLALFALSDPFLELRAAALG